MMSAPSDSDEFFNDSADDASASNSMAPKDLGMQAQIDALKADLDKTHDQLLRALAEAENTRKRTARERQETTKYAVANFARDMLSVADNLRRALDAIPADLKNDQRLRAFIEGMEATERDMQKNFSHHGIRLIDPMGELFNPNFHEVIFEASIPGKAAGEIIQVTEVGYLLYDRLLRPARVGVAKDEGQGNSRRPSTAEPGGHFDSQA